MRRLEKKLQYDNKKEIAKITALSSGKTNIHEYLTSKSILLSNQSKFIKNLSLLILFQEKL